MQVQASRATGSDPMAESFEQLFREHYDLVYRTAYRVTGNPMDAEDVLQTVFMRLVRREGAPDLSGGARGYLHRAAVNAALDVVRRRRRDAVMETAAWRIQPDEPPGPDAPYRAAELRFGLRRAIAGLHPRAAEMIVLRFLEGYSNPEIARLLSTSQATVAVILFRARRRLRKEIRSFLGA